MRTAETKVNRKSEFVQSSVSVDSIGFDLKEQGSTSTQKFFQLCDFLTSWFCWTCIWRWKKSAKKEVKRKRVRELIRRKSLILFICCSLVSICDRFCWFCPLCSQISLAVAIEGKEGRRGEEGTWSDRRVIQLTKLIISWKRERENQREEVIERAFRDIHLPSVLWFSPPLNVDEMDEEGRESEKTD